MADKKISALTAAATPLDGTEVLPIVQSGSTVKVANNDLRPKQIQSNATSGVLQVVGPAAAATRVMTVPDANFTAARTDAAQSFTGDQTLSTGNLVQGTAAKGVNFTANTPAAGMTSQLLNWYEEGTFTATLKGSTSGSTGAVTETATYTRIGRQIFIAIAFNAVITTGQTGDLQITGLPYTAGSTPGQFTGTCLVAGYTATAPIAIIDSSTSLIHFNEISGGAPIAASSGTGKYVYVSITYTV